MSMTNTIAAPSATQTTDADVELLREAPAHYRRLATELGKRIIGQEEVIRDLFVALAVQGHVLMIGVPGLAKTLLVRSLAEILYLPFQRIQFTPDLMPGDITGTEIIEEADDGRRQFRFVRGPIFASLLLADEINRTPPKTQAALLEAMQERRVTVAGRSYDLPSPFFVMATQNPIEQEGTYPLPGPLHVQPARGLSVARRGSPHPARNHRRRIRAAGKNLDRRGNTRLPARHPPGAGCAIRRRLRRRAGAGDTAGESEIT
jgi:MoxR-like ATPase